jgi:hypothetical protein
MTTAEAAVELRFDPEEHRYFVGEREMPSVTRILRPITEPLYSRIPADLLDRAITRGSFVHRATELADMGVLNWASLDPALWPYVESWQQWVRDAKAELVAIEQRVYHPALEYAGTFDRVARIKGKLAIIDIKTAAHVEGWWSLQTAGYFQAYNHGKPAAEQARRRFSVQLNPNGTYVATEHADPGDVQIFNSYLATQRWEASHGYGNSNTDSNIGRIWGAL